MKNVWNVLEKHYSTAKSGLYLAALVALLVGAFSMSTIVSAHSVSRPANFAFSTHVAKTPCPGIVSASKKGNIVESIVHPSCSTNVTTHNNAVHPHGVNGQQLALWIGSSLGFGSAVVSGQNQNGTPTAYCFVGPNGTPIAANQWHYYGGAWWLGTVSINYYTGAGCTGTDAYNTSVFVTGYQPFSDYTCFSVRTSLDPNPSGC